MWAVLRAGSTLLPRWHASETASRVLRGPGGGGKVLAVGMGVRAETVRAFPAA